MSNENKKSKKQAESTASTEVAAPEVKKEERTPGPRGELGQATAGTYVRTQYHAAHCHREDAPLKWNPNRKVWVANTGAPSLKQFARSLVTSGDALAKEWFANKRGARNQKRSDANEKAARETAIASKAARKKSKAGGGKATSA